MASPKYAVELKADEDFAAFMAGGKAVELTAENRVWETTSYRDYFGIRDLPFLKDLGEQKDAKKSGSDG